jgi:hypothetical protein
MDSELSRQNQMFQQYLAEKELGQSAQNQTFQQWLAKQQLRLSGREQSEAERQGRRGAREANRRFVLDSAQVEAQARKAEGDKTDERAKQRGERMRNGAAMLDEYLKPGKNEVNKHGQIRKAYYDRLSFDDALQVLRTKAGMGPIDSLRLLINSLPQNFPNRARWVQRGRRLLNGHLSAARGNPTNPRNDAAYQRGH